MIKYYSSNNYTKSNQNIFLHRLRKMFSFRSQICISTICGLITIATAQLGAGCPEAYGVQTYPDEKYCDRFYKVPITIRYYVCILRIQMV